MFSKELLEMDRNTVQYMIDEMQEEIDQNHKELIEQREQMSQLNLQLNQAQEKQISMIRHMMLKLNLTADEALETLGIAVEEREELKKEL